MSAGSAWGSIECRKRAEPSLVIGWHQFAAKRAADSATGSTGMRDEQVPSRSALASHSPTQPHAQFGAHDMDVLIAIDAAQLAELPVILDDG